MNARYRKDNNQSTPNQLRCLAHYIVVPLISCGLFFMSACKKSVTSEGRQVTAAASPSGDSPTSSIQASRSESKGNEFLEHLDPKNDKTSFVGTIVANECGTIGQPTNCVAKDVEVRLTRLWEINAEASRRAGVPPLTSFQMSQITVRLENGRFLTMLCAFKAPEPDDGAIRDGDVPQSSCFMSFDLGEKVLFGRNGDTIAVRSNDFTQYLLALGNCNSVHECQEVPRQINLSPDWKQSVAPWEWRGIEEREKRRQLLDVPR